jgi:hypothetical protein
LRNSLGYLDRLLSVRLFEIVVVDVGGHAELTDRANEPLENVTNVNTI